MTNAPTADDRFHHVVVVGAGFGGQGPERAKMIGWSHD
jgi:hypothetical protein